MSHRNPDSPHHVHEARHPEYITDRKVDRTVSALQAIARGEYKGKRSRESGDPTQLLFSARSSSAPGEQNAASDRHAESGKRLAGADVSEPRTPGESHPRGRIDGSRLAPQDSAVNALREPEPPAVVHARLRRTAIVPSVLTVPCETHDAQIGEHCFRTSARGICHERITCVERVKARAGLR